MFSARKLLAIVAASLAAAGCAQRVDGSRTQQLSPAPIIEDEAMTHRQWAQSVNYYANGTSLAYPTLYPYVPSREAHDVEGLFVAPVLFIGQTLALPVTIFTTPAWEQDLYGGVNTPPTYTAVPVVESDTVGYHRVKEWSFTKLRLGRDEDRSAPRD